MGCVQSNNVPVTQSNDRKKFVEHIRQSSMDSRGKVGLQNHKLPQWLQQYEYSKNGLEKQQQLKDSRVSIFSQQRKKLQQRSNRRKYMEIHPDEGERKELGEVEYLATLNEGRKSRNPNQLAPIFPFSQQLILSSILPANNNPTSNKQQQAESQLLSNFSQDFRVVDDKVEYNLQKGLLKSNGDNDNNSLLVNVNNSDTDRELIELHGELTTMIVLWENVMGKGKRLKIQKMNTEREKNTIDENQNNNKQNTQRTKRQQPDENNKQQFTKKTTKQLINNNDEKNKNKKQELIKESEQQLIIEHERVVDKDLEDIWNEGENANQLMRQKQHLNERYDCNEQSLNRGKKPPQQSANNTPDLHNPRIYIHDYLPITSTHQQPIKLNLQTILSNNNNNNNNPSSFKNFTQKQSQPSSHDSYSKCLLSNPSKILNDSLVDQKNQQKEMFYFSGEEYSKWVETGRKAYQVKIQDIVALLMTRKQLIRQEQKNYRTALLPLLCVIKDYRQVNRVNLIAFKTMTSTSILLQPSYISKLPKKSGFKIFYNGTRRLYPFEQGFDGTDLFIQLERMFANLYCYQKSLSELMYNLTGWIPETIMVNEITNYQGVFERLNNNFIDGNTIITFTGSKRQVWGLKSISLQRRQIQLYHNNIATSIHNTKQQHNPNQSPPQNNNTTQQSQQQFQQILKWSQFISMVKQINVNWNPLIYEYVWRTQNLFYFDEIIQRWKGKDNIGEFDNRYIQSMSHQYLLKIPPSEEDIEVRMFLEVHYTSDKHKLTGQKNNQQKEQYNCNQNLLVIQLHDFTGTRVNSSHSAIRIVQKHREVFSDVLIFQSSQEKTQYILVVRPQINQKQLNKIKRRQIKYTISALTFIQVSLMQIPVTRVKQQKIISTYLQQSHCGYGINSPYFLNNFYLQLKIPPLQRVKIFVSMPIDECSFELNLIANPDGEENLTRLNLDSILGDILTSEEFHSGKGYLEIQTKYEEYFFMITNHTPCKGEFKIIIQLLQNIPKYLTPTRLHSINQHFMKTEQLQQPSLLQTKQKFFYQQPILTKQFKWIPTHTGPRKRLKSNTHTGYQAFTVFRQFFKNPYIDYKVDKLKKLQFSVHSKTFMEEFDTIDQDEIRNQAQPPTISLVILKVKRPNETNLKQIPNDSLFKIILDDAFYVPFGFGFWTKPMELEQGEYRFVFPKMEKSSGVGVFRVYQINKE